MRSFLRRSIHLKGIPQENVRKYCFSGAILFQLSCHSHKLLSLGCRQIFPENRVWWIRDLSFNSCIPLSVASFGYDSQKFVKIHFFCFWRWSNFWLFACRKVAKFLFENFLARKGKEEVEVVNLSLLMKGKTKGDSARVFYELLVLFLGSFHLSGNFRSAKLNLWMNGIIWYIFWVALSAGVFVPCFPSVKHPGCALDGGA